MTVVADTSVLLNLSLLGQARVVVDLFGTVLAPPEVQAEFRRLAASDPRFLGLPFPEFVQVCPVAAIHSLLLGDRHLHTGEIATLSLAEERKADVVLLDDRAARASAQALGLRVVGVVGILLEGKRAGHVAAVGPLLDRLETVAKFWMSRALRQKILLVAGENQT